MPFLVRALSVRMEQLSSRRFEETGCLHLHVFKVHKNDSLFESSDTTNTETRNHIPAVTESTTTDQAARGSEGIILC
jgi:hypothetical protein